MDQVLKLTGSEIKDFIQIFLGFAHVEDCDSLRSDLRLDDAGIDELVNACNKNFEAKVETEKLQTIKQLIKRVKNTAKVNQEALSEV